jgi:hypothetical protein
MVARAGQASEPIVAAAARAGWAAAQDVGSGSPGPLSAKVRHERGYPREVLAIRGHSLEQVYFFQARLEEGPQDAEGAGERHPAAWLDGHDHARGPSVPHGVGSVGA